MLYKLHIGTYIKQIRQPKTKKNCYDMFFAK